MKLCADHMVWTFTVRDSSNFLSVRAPLFFIKLTIAVANEALHKIIVKRSQSIRITTYKPKNTLIHYRCTI